MQLLHGLVVIEVATTRKAAYCGRLFADCGADVIKVELPDHDRPPGERLWLDRGKANVILDWRAGDGQALLAQLAGRASVLVHDIQPGEYPAMAALLAALQRDDSRLIVTSVSDFGRDGPFAGRPATDLTVAALSGICMINGVRGRQPLREPGNQTALVAALAGFIGTLAAMANRTVTGGGQAVDASALEAMVNVLSPSILQCSYQRGGPARRASATGYLFDCADGQVSIIISSQRSWQTLTEIWGIEAEPGDARFASEGARRVNMDAVRALLRPALESRTRRDVFEELCTVRVPCGILTTPAELITDPHLVQRGSIVRAEAEEHALALSLPGPSFRVAGEPPAASQRLRPCGADTVRMLVEQTGAVGVSG